MMTLDELKNKASKLPMEPGVYLMYDASGTIIYVGKAKKLRNRVCQYFLDLASHTPKTKKMVSMIDSFDVIITSNEFEALVLECSLIKRHMPKYNILLKDDKGFPYVRIDFSAPYPRMTIENNRKTDGAIYFGPFGSRGVTQKLIDTLTEVLMLPGCNRIFSQRIKKGRPCLNYHLGKCVGWCQEKHPYSDYCERIDQLKQILSGNFSQVINKLSEQMEQAAEDLNFELAASLRDRIKALNGMKQKQFVISGKASTLDAIGYAESETVACFSILHFVSGELVDKEFQIISPDEKTFIVSSLMKQYYLNLGFAPRTILMPFETDDRELFNLLLNEKYARKIEIKVPQRGMNVRLIELACKNAHEEAIRVTRKEDKHRVILEQFGNMLGINSVRRIESFDISNISGTDNVASMIVFQDGSPLKSAYKRFKIDLAGNQDDYQSMRVVLSRRLADYCEKKPGFEQLPNLWLIDGGASHAKIAEEILKLYNICIPVFGMVKDDRHRTRALINSTGEEIRIDNRPAIFSLVGNIQEQTHNFAISYHKKLRSKHLKYSELDKIPGIGPKRKADLLKHFSSISAIKNASLSELNHYLPIDAAQSVYSFYHNSEGQGTI